MKKLIFSVSVLLTAVSALAYFGPVEIYSTKAKEEILSPVTSKKNFSGLTFVADTKSYYAIINKGDRIFEFDEQFNLKREIAIQGFDDPEDLAFIRMTPQGPLLAISEETGSILFGVLGAGSSLSASSMKRIALLDEAGRELRFYDNKGIEGICYIPGEEKIVLIKEKSPMGVWSFSLAEANKATAVRVKNYLPSTTENSIARLATDLSAASWNAKEKALVLLSDESSKLIYIDLASKEISKVVEIKTKLQHEALSFSADFETTFVGAEPYYLFRINKTNTALIQSF